MMRWTMWTLSALLAVFPLAGCSQGTTTGPDSKEQQETEQQQTITATAQLQNADGDQVGTATLTEGEDGVEIRLEAKDLKPGKHGFHIHETGTCEAPDFKSAGGHFNPEDKAHGVDNPQGSHVGDLPNLEIGSDGKGELTATAKGATLEEGKNSLLKEGGTALVIHAEPDDMKTDPAGDAGDRVACGVIQEK